MDELASSGASATVIIQRSRETQAAFALRVRERASVLASRGELPATILFVASTRSDLPTVHGRASIACNVVSALASTSATRGRGRFLVACDRSSSREGVVDMKRAALATSARLSSIVHVADARPAGDPRKAEPEPKRLAAVVPLAVPELPLPAA
jgi:hypothetical protein